MRPADLALIAQARADLSSGAARSARRTAAVRQSEVAEVLGVGRSTISQWEAGVRVPSAEHALAYGKLLRQLARKAA